MSSHRARGGVLATPHTGQKACNAAVLCSIEVLSGFMLWGLSCLDSTLHKQPTDLFFSFIYIFFTEIMCVYATKRNNIQLFTVNHRSLVAETWSSKSAWLNHSLRNTEGNQIRGVTTEPLSSAGKGWSLIMEIQRLFNKERDVGLYGVTQRLKNHRKRGRRRDRKSHLIVWNENEPLSHSSVHPDRERLIPLPRYWLIALLIMQMKAVQPEVSCSPCPVLTPLLEGHVSSASSTVIAAFGSNSVLWGTSLLRSFCLAPVMMKHSFLNILKNYSSNCVLRKNHLL